MSSFHIAATRVVSVPRRRIPGIVVGATMEVRGGCRLRQYSSIGRRIKSASLQHQQHQKCWKYRPLPLPYKNSTFRNQQWSHSQRRTMMARSSVYADSEDPSLDPEAKAMTFLVGTLGHEKDVAKGVLDALKQSGISGGPALLAMVRSLAGRWEVDEDAGLEALVESVTVELARSKGKKTVTVWILPGSAWASKEGDDESVVKDDFKRAFKVEGFEDMVRIEVTLPPAIAPPLALTKLWHNNILYGDIALWIYLPIESKQASRI